MQDDMIRPLQHIDARSVDDAISTLKEHGREATVIAGNTDEINWLKNRSRAPKVLVDIKPIDELYGFANTSGGGLSIGPLETVSSVAENESIDQRFGVLSDAAEDVASLQIRNMGTIGGNLSQDSRCWYYRGGFDCYRAGGQTCYAMTGRNSDHAVTDYSRCITAHPSDCAVALMALDAEIDIRGTSGKRSEKLSEFFVGPESNITVMNDLDQTEVLTKIRVPGTWAGASFYWEKIADRKAWDFPIVNIAAAIKKSGNTVQDLRLVANGVAPTPKRLTGAERAIKGKKITEANAKEAGKKSLPNAAPLSENRFKVPMTANLVKRALLNADT